jgi:hypothetical protein
MVVNKNFYFHNAATTTGNGEEYTVANANSLTVQISGTSNTRTIVFEGTVDGTNWTTIAGANVSTDFTIATQTTATGEIWTFSIDPLYKVRMRIHAIGTGNVTIVGRITE